MSIITIPLGKKPDVALLAIGIHGPARREPYRVRGHWCLHLYTYHGEVLIEGVPYQIHPGCVGVLPPNADTVYTFHGRSYHACSHFTLPEPDSSDDLVEIPIMQDAGARFGAMYQAMESAIACLRSSRTQAEVRLWDLLWQLQTRPASGSVIEHNLHPSLVQATRTIEAHLADLMPISRIAEAAGISHNQLIRLFRQRFGQTVAEYIAARRAERAEHMLTRTHLPIRTVAAQVGFDDPRLFNKLIHRTLGASPSEIRARSERG